MPGMTANVTIAVEQAHDVLKIPVAALKFVPQKAGGKNRRHANDSARPGGEGPHQPDSAATRSPGSRFAKKSGARIFILENGRPVRVPVTTGLSSGGFTAVEGAIHAGQEVLIGTSNPAKATVNQGTPLGMPRRMH
jgi:hypothetical protein